MNFNQNLTITKYNGNLPFVNKIVNLIERKYSDLFYAVIVHGSVATNEIIPYSDFDGLLIVKDQYVNSKQLKDFKKESMKHILKFDPLQHHGWFQIKESELLNYPESYFPIEILKYSKSIFPKSTDGTLDIIISENVDYKKGLLDILNQFEERSKNNWKPKNMYQLKSMLSQIMLIPCLYYSVINNRGIFKRESFETVKPFFDAKEWMSIEVASKIRSEWNYDLNFFQKIILRRPERVIRKVAKTFFSPKINSEFSQQLDVEFYKNLVLLTNKIKSTI